MMTGQFAFNINIKWKLSGDSVNMNEQISESDAPLSKGQYVWEVVEV